MVYISIITLETTVVLAVLEKFAMQWKKPRSMSGKRAWVVIKTLISTLNAVLDAKEMEAGPFLPPEAYNLTSSALTFLPRKIN